MALRNLIHGPNAMPAHWPLGADGRRTARTPGDHLSRTGAVPELETAAGALQEEVLQALKAGAGHGRGCPVQGNWAIMVFPLFSGDDIDAWFFGAAGVRTNSFPIKSCKAHFPLHQSRGVDLAPSSSRKACPMKAARVETCGDLAA